MTTRFASACLVAATAVLTGVALSGATASADPTVAGDPFDANEVAFLNEVHRDGAGRGITGDDESIVQDGYYACHILALSGPPPAAYGIDPLVTEHAIAHFCPNV